MVMAFINAIVFILVLTLGWHIGWKSGYEDVIKATKEVLDNEAKIATVKTAEAIEKAMEKERAKIKAMWEEKMNGND
jgi:hypothetical protein